MTSSSLALLFTIFFCFGVGQLSYQVRLYNTGDEGTPVCDENAINGTVIRVDGQCYLSPYSVNTLYIRISRVTDSSLSVNYDVNLLGYTTPGCTGTPITQRYVKFSQCIFNGADSSMLVRFFSAASRATWGMAAAFIILITFVAAF